MNKGNIDTRYRFVKKLGAGEIAEVYQVADEQNSDQTQFLKILKKSNLKKKQAQAMFVAELELLQKLEHSSIPPMLATGTFEQRPYFVTTWVEGVDLETSCKSVNLNKIHFLFLQLLDILNYLHQQKIYHLDLKPDNIMVTTQGRPQVMLIDFGIAAWLHQHPDADLGLVGTVPYAAPELAQGNNPTAASDLYSLGVILFELLTNKKPFPGDDVGQILANQFQGKNKSMWEDQDQVWHAMEQVVLALMQLQPKDRPQSVQAVIDLINRYENENYQLPFTNFYDELPIVQQVANNTMPKFSGDWELAIQQVFDFYKNNECSLGLKYIESFWQESYWEQCPKRFLLEWVRLYLDQCLYDDAKKLIQRIDYSQLADFDKGFYHEVYVKWGGQQSDLNLLEQHFNQAWKFYEATHYHPGKIRLLLSKSALLIKIREFIVAKQLLEQIIQISAGQQPFYERMASERLAALHYQQGNFILAKLEYEKLLTQYSLEHDKRFICEAYLQLSLIANNLGKMNEGKTFILKAYKLALESGFNYLLGDIQFFMARVLLKIEDYVAAREHLTEAIYYYQKFIQKNRELEARFELARVCWALKEYKEMQASLQFVLSHAAHASTTFVNARWLQARLMIEKLWVAEESIEDIFQEIMQYFESHQLKQLLWQLNCDMGESWLKKSNQAKAKECYLLAKQNLEEYLNSLDESHRQSFLRGRQHLRIQEMLNKIEGANHG